MQETEHRVIPDPYQQVAEHLFAYLLKNGVAASLEENHLPLVKFSESDGFWLTQNGYEVITLPGNSIKYWVDRRKEHNLNCSPIKISCIIPEEIYAQKYQPTEVAVNRSALFIEGAEDLSFPDQIARMAEQRRKQEQIPQTIDMRAATLPQHLDLVMKDFQTNALRIAFGMHYQNRRTRTGTSIEQDAHYSIGLIPGIYRATIIRAESDSAKREKLGLATLLFPGSNPLQLAA
jgi:hypothetical protein